MAKQLFKGFKQVLSGGTFENGYLYFVRDDASKEHGYLYFNGKKYGTTKEIYNVILSIQSSITDEESARIAMDNILQSAITAEETARQNAITGVQGQISAEQSARTAEDQRLNNLITAETANRESAITGVQNQITAETSARESAITGVQGQISAEQSARTANDVKDVKYDSENKLIYIEFNNGSTSTGFDATAFIVDGMLSSVTYDSTAHTITFIWNTYAGGKEMTVDLDDVIAAYNADETTIHKGENNTFSVIMDQNGGAASYQSLLGVQGQVTAETAARESAIEGVQGQISDEQTARQNAITGVQNQITAETAARESAISGVQGRIDGLTATKSGESYGVQVEVAQEHGALKSVTVDASGVQGKITGVQTQLSDVQSNLQGQINTEVSARTEAIEGVQGQISDEQTARQNAITAEASARTAADDALEESIRNLNDKVDELDGTTLPVGVDIPSGTTSGTTITNTLADIYEKLHNSVNSVVSNDHSIDVTPTSTGVDLSLNRETATNATVANGHIEILLNASGETYAQMYYDGNDVE